MTRDGDTLVGVAVGGVPTPVSQVRLLIVGGRGVGKSALTVRYLTKRFIGDYQSYSDLQYRQMVKLDGAQVELEIVDVSNKPGEERSLPWLRVRVSDAVIVVYSITDRASFHNAREALDCMTTSAPSLHIPVLLLANKADLQHLRKVSVSEGRDLSRQYNTAFHEVSVADDPAETLKILNTVVRELHRVKRAQQREAWQQSARGAWQDSASTRGAWQDTASTASSTPPAEEREKTRKMSVFNMSRVFSSILGRSSLPPELGERTRSSTGMSLKKVFKKRSV